MHHSIGFTTARITKPRTVATIAAKYMPPPTARPIAATVQMLAAVVAGLTEGWSNGPVEGFVNKLNLIKRQSYGRASFEVLRRRIVGKKAA